MFPTENQPLPNTTPPMISNDYSQSLLKIVRQYLSPEELGRVKEALEFAGKAHEGVFRKSGDPYITHPITIATYLADYSLDAPTLMAALLHDVVEDTSITMAQINQYFGETVMNLVDGVTKLTGLDDQDERTLHNLFKAAANDERVALIKLFDRLHNMETISFMSKGRQQANAKETLRVYAPFANRLGMWEIKNQLGVLSSKILDPKMFHQIEKRLNLVRERHAKLFGVISNQVKDTLANAGIEADVRYHPRNIYSIFRDINETKLDIDNIDDSMRLAVLVDERMLCYQAVGILHQKWPPVADTFDDYIALSKENLYRSLHTTVAHPESAHLKLRVCTPPMLEISTIGVLAKWRHHATPLYENFAIKEINSFLDSLKNSIEDIEMDQFKSGLAGVIDSQLGDQIKVFTPKGEEKMLRNGATPVDFAFAVHTEVGLMCDEARIAGVKTPLNVPLKYGDQVQIIKKKGKPRLKTVWLDEDLGYIVTPAAKNKLRRWLRKLPAEEAVAIGKKLIDEELILLGCPQLNRDELAISLNCQNVDDLYMQLGRAELSLSKTATHIAEIHWKLWRSITVGTPFTANDGATYIIKNAEGKKLKPCKICDPAYGVRILGYLLSDNSVTVHREGCRLIRRDSLKDRSLKLEWGEQEAVAEARVVTLQVDIRDRTGILHEVTGLLSDEGINIDYVGMPRGGQDKHIEFDFVLNNPRQMVQALHRIKALVNVYQVRCLLPASANPPKNDLPYYPPE